MGKNGSRFLRAGYHAHRRVEVVLGVFPTHRLGSVDSEWHLRRPSKLELERDD